MFSREIKFRVWNVNLERFVSPIYSIVDGISTNGSNKIMQYIGLKDKNGKEIYEGDYLVDYYPIDEEDESKGMNESLLPVVWCNKTLSWCVDASFSKDGSYLTSLVDYFEGHLEVKGNIYENKI